MVSELGMKSCKEGHLPVPSDLLFFSLMDCFLVCCQTPNVLTRSTDGSFAEDRYCSCRSGTQDLRWCPLLNLQPGFHEKKGEAALLDFTGGAGLICRNLS